MSSTAATAAAPRTPARPGSARGGTGLKAASVCVACGRTAWSRRASRAVGPSPADADEDADDEQREGEHVGGRRTVSRVEQLEGLVPNEENDGRGRLQRPSSGGCLLYTSPSPRD